MRKFKELLAVCLSVAICMSTLVFTLPASAEELTEDEQLALKAAQLENDMAAFTETVPTVEYHSDYDITDIDGVEVDIKALTYEGANIDGKPTKAFAYIGYPENIEEGKKYPAVVLVHGGGGHAFPKWVKKWNDNGYIAIAMDNTGHFPNAQGGWTWGLSNSAFAETGYANAPNNDSYGNIEGDLDKQWMYHAVAQVILAKGVLEADSAVDASKIGIYGISWGSIITNTTIGFEKFAFAISQYVASHFEISDTYRAEVPKLKGYKELWKADARFSRVDFPVLYEQYNYDWSSSLRAISQCHEDLLGAGSVMSLRPNWVHTHDWDTPIEVYRFAKSVTNGGQPLTTFATQPGTSRDINCKINIPSDAESVKARLYYLNAKQTYTYTPGGSSDWSANQVFSTLNLNVENGVVTGTLPKSAVEFYVEITTVVDGQTYYTSSLYRTADANEEEGDSGSSDTDEEDKTQFITDFENGDNPFPVIDNVYSAATHYSTDSQYITLSSEEEALNGKSSLKVNIPAGNSRTEVVFADATLSDGGKPFNRYITSASDAQGLLIRLKINKETSVTDHKFSVWLWQSGVGKYTFLADGSVLYDLNGKTVNNTSGARSCTIPAGFDGFVFLPFAEAHSSCDCDGNHIYDNYKENPECLIDYTDSYNISIVFGFAGDDSSWDNTQVLLDDICVVGAGAAGIDNAIKACGYDISVGLIDVPQPEKYTVPITSENFWNPLGNITAFMVDSTAVETDNVKYTAKTSLTNKASEVLNGKYSMKIDFDLSKYTSENTVVQKIRTDYFTVEGIKGLSAEEIKAAASDGYAYFKVRVKVPNDGNTYYFWTFFKQQGAQLCNFHNSGVAYNTNGTINSSVVFNGNGPTAIPSGFDGYLYYPVYRLREMQNEIYTRYSSVYVNPQYTDKAAPDLSKDFQLAFEFKHSATSNSDTTIDTLNNCKIIIDDIDFVFGGNSTSNPPHTFEGEMHTMPQAQQYKSGNFAVQNISKVTGKDALNGNGSIKVDIVGDSENNYFYNSVTFSKVSGITSDSDVEGVMFRLKLINDNTTGTGKNSHAMFMVLGQSGKVDDIVNGKRIKLFDANGRPLDSSEYAADDMNLHVPAGFDGFVFFPLDEASRIKQYGDQSAPRVDTSSAFDIKFWFVYTSNWEGVDAIIDDVYYYSVSDSSAGLTNADALKAIKDCGYDVGNGEGDFNGDGSADVKDVIVLKKFLLGTNTESNTAFDLNLDGEVDIRDLIKLKNLMANV